MNCKVWLKCCCYGGAAITKLSVGTGLLEYRNLAFKDRKKNLWLFFCFLWCLMEGKAESLK